MISNLEKMDDAIVHAKIVGYNYMNENQENKNFESSKEDCLELKHGNVLLASSIKNLEISDICTNNLFLQQMCVLKKRIPKQIMGLEEKYLRHCLELIHMNMRANSWHMPSSKVNSLADKRVVNGDTLFLFSSSVDQPIVGSITGSRSMINLLNSPLLRQLGAPDGINTDNTNKIEFKEALSCDSLQDLQRKRVEVPEDDIFEANDDDHVHNRLVSFSSTNSTFSDPSSFSSSSCSSSSSGAYSQGMLHCSWNYGFPRYVFSVEDQVYTTNLSKVDNKFEGLDYVYTFHSRSGNRENEIHEQEPESDVVAKMRVSTSFALETQVMETQFVLCATNEGGIQTSNQMIKKNKGLTKKVASIFRRRRSCSKFDGSVSVQLQEQEVIEQNEEESSFPTNLELAAIVVKDNISCSEKKVEEVGGWGLKFLKEGGQKQTTKQHSSCSSMSMDVVVPAGFHGGPKTKNGGPSSLVDRWQSGGSCDCGGWDVGCPITLLNAGPNNKDVLYKSGVFGKSNSFELFTQGCKQSLAAVEVRNVHDGLYYIHYQSTLLSALQSLSIAVAIIHSHSPTLKPKLSSI